MGIVNMNISLHRFARRMTYRKYRGYRTSRKVIYFLMTIVCAIMIIIIFEYGKCDRMSCVTMNENEISVRHIWPTSGIMYAVFLTWASWTGTEPIVISMESTGGWFVVARWMRDWTAWVDARHGVQLVAKATGRCESFCTYVWSSAADRRAAPEASFMFHEATWIERKDGKVVKVLDEEGTRAMVWSIQQVDPRLAAFLEARGAFDSARPDVPLKAAEIAALGGDYLRLDPALR